MHTQLNPQNNTIIAVKTFLRNSKDNENRLTFLLDRIFSEFYRLKKSIKKEDMIRPKLMLSLHSKQDLQTLFGLCNFFSYTEVISDISTIYVESLVEELRYLKQNDTYAVILRLSISGNIFFTYLLNEIIDKEIPYIYGDNLNKDWYFVI